MAIKLLFFRPLAEVTGTPELQLENVKDTDALQEVIHSRYSRLKSMGYRIAVDKKLVTGAHALQHENGVALLPPFSGG